MAKTVTLANKRPHMLPPIHVPELGLRTQIVHTNDRNKATGEVAPRKLNRQLPQAITLCARGTQGDRVTGLPESAATSPEVAAARERGDITVSVSATPGEE